MGEYFFDKVYNKNELIFGNTPSQMLVDFLQNNQLIGNALDLGCGEGRDTILLLNMGFSVRAIDKSKIAIQKIQSRLDLTEEMRNRLSTEVVDLIDYKWPFKNFDLIIAVTVLDHMEENEAKAVCKNLIKSAKSGAYIFVQVHSDRDPAIKGDGPVSEFASQIKHYYGANELIKIFLPCLRILKYDDSIEWDLDHGRPHKHGFITLIGCKE